MERLISVNLTIQYPIAIAFKERLLFEIISEEKYNDIIFYGTTEGIYLTKENSKSLKFPLSNISKNSFLNINLSEEDFKFNRLFKLFDNSLLG